MSLRKMNWKKQQLEDELMNLHVGEPPLEYYRMQREKLELEIARMEEKIVMETKLRPLRYATAVVVIGLLTLIYFLV